MDTLIINKDFKYQIYEGLTIFTNIYIVDCDFDYFPHGVTIYGDMTIENCNMFKELSSDMTITGNVTIKNCKSFERLIMTRVGGSLVVDNCDALCLVSGYDEYMEVIGSTTISRCHEIVLFGHNLFCHGKLSINNCDGIESIIVGLKLGDGLSIDCCKSLYNIEDDIIVNGDTNITSCPKFNHIASGIFHGDLVIKKCEEYSFSQSLCLVSGDYKVGDTMSLRLRYHVHQ